MTLLDAVGNVIVGDGRCVLHIYVCNIKRLCIVSSLDKSELGDICNCCAETPSTKCEEDKMLKMYPGYSCNTMRVLLKVSVCMCSCQREKLKEKSMRSLI